MGDDVAVLSGVRALDIEYDDDDESSDVEDCGDCIFPVPPPPPRDAPPAPPPCLIVSLRFVARALFLESTSIAAH